MTEKLAKAQYRHEYKYLCNAAQSAILKTRAQAILAKDDHAGPEGAYRIRSLYFDDWDDRCYYENESGIGERDKYRIRIYNGDSTRITLEKKSKNRGMTLKESCLIGEELCRQLMRGEAAVIRADMNKTQKQLLTEMQVKSMRPVVIVDYLRYPFVEPNGNVRITFDKDISSSNDIDRFLDSEITVRPVMEEGWGILEVKWDAFLPDHLKRSMELESLMWSSFSKYYLCRRYNMYGGIRI